MARLDLSHGFVKHIQKNQIERGEWDLSERARRSSQRARRTQGPMGERRPDQQVYRPPKVKPAASSDTIVKQTTQLEHGRTLQLEYEDDNGHVTSVTICEEESEEEMVSKVGKAAGEGLTEELSFFLLLWLRRELDRRWGRDKAAEQSESTTVEECDRRQRGSGRRGGRSDRDCKRVREYKLRNAGKERERKSEYEEYQL
uniref:UPF0561 protein C2orf68 homolog isoform X2 n=1 Tax=Myxine glutinosa TaxID=7769 RepID=UPI00358F845A